MKLLDFEANNKRYCLIKLDNHNFSVREYLPQPKEVAVNKKVTIQEFKPTLFYFGSLEYAIRKAFTYLGKDYIKKEDYSSYTLSNDSLKSIFDLKPYEVTIENLDSVKEELKRVIDYDK